MDSLWLNARTALISSTDQVGDKLVDSEEVVHLLVQLVCHDAGTCELASRFYERELRLQEVASTPQVGYKQALEWCYKHPETNLRSTPWLT